MTTGGGGSGSPWNITDGMNTVNSVGLLTVTGGTVGGTTPNATLLITGGVSSVTATQPLFSSGSSTPNISLDETTGSGQVMLQQNATASSPTVTTSLNLNYATPSEIAGTDISSNLVSLSTATYPSLTELSYVKGVTSAIQTQINTKGSGTVTSVTATQPLASSGGTTPNLSVDETTGSGQVVLQSSPTVSSPTVTTVLNINAANIATDTSTGTQIATSTTQKIGFYGSSPIVRPSGDILTGISNLNLVTTPTVAQSDITGLVASGKTGKFNNSITFAGTDATTETFPASSATVGALGIAENWTALQQFNNNKFALVGTGSGSTVLNSGLTGSINSTVTLPASTTTVGGLGIAETWTQLQQFTSAAFNLGSDASYDMYYRGSNGQVSRVGNGVSGQCLNSTTNGAPTWGSCLTTTGSSGSYSATFTNASLSAGVLTVTHNLGVENVAVSIYDNNLHLVIPDSVVLTDSNDLTVSLVSYGTISGTWTVVVMSGSGINYPVAGIVNSTGTGWGASYNTNGIGNRVVLSTSPTITTLSLSAGTTSSSPLNIASGTNVTTPVSGNKEYDGYSFYGTSATGRGIMPSESIMALNSTYTLTSQTALQALFNIGTANTGKVNVAGNTSYYFECLFSLSSMSASVGSFGFGWGGTAQIASINAMSLAEKSGSTPQTAQMTQFSSSASSQIVTTSTATTGQALIKGFLRTGTAGTLQPEVTLGVAASAVVGVNSYFYIYPASSNKVITVGNIT